MSFDKIIIMCCNNNIKNRNSPSNIHCTTLSVYIEKMKLVHKNIGYMSFDKIINICCANNIKNHNSL